MSDITSAGDPGSVQLLVFTLQADTPEQRAERYAIPVRHVRELLTMQHIVRLPSAGGGFLGVVNLRDVMYPVIELASALALANAPATHLMMACEFAGKPVMFSVYGVDEMYDVPCERVTAAQDLLAGQTRETVASLAKVSDEQTATCLNYETLVARYVTLAGGAANDADNKAVALAA